MEGLKIPIGSTVIPGDRIGTIRQIVPGLGTYARHGRVYASVVGALCVETKENHQVVATVVPATPRQVASTKVLRVGQVVLTRVLRITSQQAIVEIVAVEGWGAVTHTHEGIIKREDIRTASMELVQESFLPGDFVLCRILSMGDTRRYGLTTAEPELGVLYATAKNSGKPMLTVSWKEMECPETGHKERRKCARPRKLIPE